MSNLVLGPKIEAGTYGKASPNKPYAFVKLDEIERRLTEGQNEEVDGGETDSSEIDVGDDQAERSAGDSLRHLATLELLESFGDGEDLTGEVLSAIGAVQNLPQMDC